MRKIQHNFLKLAIQYIIRGHLIEHINGPFNIEKVSNQFKQKTGLNRRCSLVYSVIYLKKTVVCSIKTIIVHDLS